MTDLSLLPPGFWTICRHLSRLEIQIAWERRPGRRRLLLARRSRWEGKLQALKLRQALER